MAESKAPIFYHVDLSQNPASWPGPETTGFININKVDVIFVNMNSSSDFRMLRTGTNGHVHEVLVQVTKHVERGLYRIVNLSLSEYSCTVVMTTEKKRDELMFKNGFPWDKDDDANPEPEPVTDLSM